MFFRLAFFKYIITAILFFLSIYFFFTGYNSLDFSYSNKLLIQKNLKSLDETKVFNLKKNNHKDLNISSNITKKKDETTDEIEKIITVKKNDTFSKIIDSFSLNKKTKNKLIFSLGKKYNLKNLKINQKIYFYQNDKNELIKIKIPINFSSDLIVKLDNDKIFIDEKKYNITKELSSNKIIINSSIYKDGIDGNIPISVITEAIRLLSFDVDFQRDIQKDNILELSYETLSNESRNEFSYGKIKYINLIFKKNNLEYFYFKTNDGYVNYFNKEGKNAQKSLMKTPIDGARLSSSFGMRKHPISGYNKMHKGLDFAAPKGTPIYAAGNGVIEYVGKNGGYGNYIRIRHNSSYKTAYAHLSKYKKGIYKGLRVNQGEIIGYVGSTGVSTGPHLHYEVIYMNKQINPKKMNLPSISILEGKELERFNKEMKTIYSNFLFNLYE
tara:strand:+ start:771 stop:2090 length:1320 start_codon:yes stop_codon:yes gene_type:complete